MDYTSKSKTQLKKILESLNLNLTIDINSLSKQELINVLEKTEYYEEKIELYKTKVIGLEEKINVGFSPLEKRKWKDYLIRCGLTAKEFLSLYPNHSASEIIKTL